MDKIKYRTDNIRRQIELLNKDKMSDSDLLEYVSLDIKPYSTYWRMGVKRALSRAIRLIKREDSK